MDHEGGSELSRVLLLLLLLLLLAQCWTLCLWLVRRKTGEWSAPCASMCVVTVTARRAGVAWLCAPNRHSLDAEAERDCESRMYVR